MQKKNIMEIWDAMKRPNHWTVGIEEGEDSQWYGPDLQEDHRQKLPRAKERQTHYISIIRTPNRHEQQIKSPWNNTPKTLIIEQRKSIESCKTEKL